MDKNLDGGPAFPYLTASERDREVTTHEGEHGMSLRDYFAAKAMVGLCHFWVQVRTQTSSINDPDPNVIAPMAYEYADAMLAARQS